MPGARLADGKKRDGCSPQSSQIRRRAGEPTVHAITFYSQGPPHDDGMPLAAQAALLEAAMAPHVHSFRAFTLTEVRSLRLPSGELGEAAVRPSA
eukprot:7305988-Prymnesium_polylepis.1